MLQGTIGLTRHDEIELEFAFSQLVMSLKNPTTRGASCRHRACHVLSVLEELLQDGLE
jgi:hypothetical protein